MLEQREERGNGEMRSHEQRRQFDSALPHTHIHPLACCFSVLPRRCVDEHHSQEEEVRLLIHEYLSAILGVPTRPLKTKANRTTKTSTQQQRRHDWTSERAECVALCERACVLTPCCLSR